MSQTEIDSACNDASQAEIKSEFEAMLLSYMFLFIDKKNTHVGAGDLATSSLPTGLSSSYNYYFSTQTLLTNIYNEMLNSSLPLSVLEFPIFFTLPFKDQCRNINATEWNYIKATQKLIDLANITDEAIRNYHYLWWTYTNNKNNMTLFCNSQNGVNCSDPTRYTILTNEPEYQHYVNAIKRNPDNGKLVEGYVTDLPCSNIDIIQKFKIDPICNFHQKIIDNKHSFLKLMKFTKQCPVYTETEQEYLSLFQNLNKTLHSKDFIARKEKVIILCLQIYFP